jgi:hypothetical protein
MRIRVISRETFNEIVVNVPENIRVRDFKRKIYEETGDNSIHYSNLFFDGEILHENRYLRNYGIEDMDQILIQHHYVGGGLELENSVYSTNIHAVNKRENVGNKYYYKIKGSNEGTVWGDHIYTDDSNIAQAAVLEGKCQLGQEKIVGIKMIEGKSSYSSSNRNGVSSVTYGSWPASYIFTDDV